MPHTKTRKSISVRAILILSTIAGVWGAFDLRSHAQGLGPGTVQGVVAGSDFTPPSPGVSSSTAPSYYQHVTVCADVDGNGACSSGEPAAVTDDHGAFSLTSPGAVEILAEVAAGSTNGSHPVTQRIVLRAAADQAADGPLVVSPLSTEVARMMDADQLSYQTATQKLATRLDVPIAQVLADPNTVADSAIRASLLKESVILTNRFGLATRMLDRHDVATIKQAQQAVMNLEAIPRYDHIFIIVLENKATSSIKNSPFAPKINAYLNGGNQFTSYFATGNPSEPNRVAMVSGDDFGIVDDSAWNCLPSGDVADLAEDPLPPGMGPCTNATNHNIKNRPNLITAMMGAGMTWRVYNESMNPGRDWRLNSAADNSIVAPDHLYPAGSPVGAIGTPGLMVRMPGSLYATKHNESVNFQAIRSAPEFVPNNRTMGGGQWDEALRNAPSTPATWNPDQFGTDLASGDIGNLNFLEPDQCDDMHGVTAQGTVPPSSTLRTASDCSGNAMIYRGDNYTDYLIKKIQASSSWTNTEKRSAIVIMFDEGTATTGFNSCCGWNPSAGASIAGQSLGPLVNNGGGTSIDTVARYNQGNKGHGTSIFGVLTNQPLAPKHVVDSDAHSHISFVRTLQDMFGLADPGDPWSYMNRSKYTDSFIAANLPFLPEYANSGDPHFDAVRPMNHSYVIPPDYVQKSGFVTPPGAQVGADANQLNVWALKYDPPATTATATPAPNAAGWNRTAVTVALQAHDSPAGPGIDHLTYGVTGAQGTPATMVAGDNTSFQLTGEGTNTVTFFATGAGQSVETPQALSVRIDTAPPSVSGVVSPAANASGWTNMPVTVTFACGDSLSGLAVGAPAPAVLSAEGAGQSASATCSDIAGNEGSFTVSNINIDRTAPVITPQVNLTVVETTAGGSPVIYSAPAIVETGSGLASSSCLPASGSVFAVGTTTVTCKATDVAGNLASATFSVTVTGAQDGRMYGVGHLDDGGKHHHFVFRVSQERFRDNGRVEYWVNDPRRCGRDRDEDYDHDRDYDGDHDHNYGREHCNPTNRFESTAVTTAVFSDDPGFRPGRSGNRKPTMDTVAIFGTGKWNGRSGYTFEMHASDQGEPGRHRDTFSIVVKDAHGVVVASASDELDGGNIQSTRLRNLWGF